MWLQHAEWRAKQKSKKYIVAYLEVSNYSEIRLYYRLKKLQDKRCPKQVPPELKTRTYNA
jgi:hypothetical protein